jgi:putative flippase GtrA
VSLATALRRPVAGQLVVFGAIGVATTVVHLGGFVLLREVTPAQLANALALLVAATVNTWGNRRWTFGVRGRAGAARHQVQGLLVLGLTLGLTSSGLRLLGVVAPDASTRVEAGAVAATTVLATALKFLAMRWWVFGPAEASGGRGRSPILLRGRADG